MENFININFYNAEIRFDINIAHAALTNLPWKIPVYNSDNGGKALNYSVFLYKGADKNYHCCIFKDDVAINTFSFF